MPAPSDSATAANYWSNKDGYAPNWYSICAGYINRRITGDAKVAPTMWSLGRLRRERPIGHLFEIGCLDGRKLRNIIDAGIAAKVSGVDNAEGAIARGRQTHGDNVDLQIQDLNAPALPRETFDVVLSNGVLHHIANIDACVRALYDALTPGGALVASEFTGPKRYVYSDDEIATINAGMNMLPPELRGPPFHPSPLAAKLRADPSESITTREIEPTLRAVFDTIDATSFGGDVLMRALTARFFKAFNPDFTNAC